MWQPVHHDRKEVGNGGIFPEVALSALAHLPVKPGSTSVELTELKCYWSLYLFPMWDFLSFCAGANITNATCSLRFEMLGCPHTAQFIVFDVLTTVPGFS